MNLAFPALFVLLLLLPGILLSYSYRRGFFRRSPITLGPIRDEIGRGIVWALLIHPVVLSLLWSAGAWSPDPDLLLALTGWAVEVGWFRFWPNPRLELLSFAGEAPICLPP